jgi:hypothetical protein
MLEFFCVKAVVERVHLLEGHQEHCKKVKTKTKLKQMTILTILLYCFIIIP